MIDADPNIYALALRSMQKILSTAPRALLQISALLTAGTGSGVRLGVGGGICFKSLTAFEREFICFFRSCTIFGSGADEVAVFSILLSIIVSFSGRENSGLKTKNDATIKTSAAIKRNCFILQERCLRIWT